MKQNDSRVLFNNGKNKRFEFAPIIVADNIRTPENIGNLMRLAANIGIQRIVCVGSEIFKEFKIKKTACVAWNYVELIYTNHEDFEQYIPEDYQFVALETTPQSVSIFSQQLPKKMALVVGNEINGVGVELLQKCKIQVNIPMTGAVTSMNVSHAAAVAMFEWVRQNLN